MALDRYAIGKRFTAIQDNICKGLEEADGGASFERDLWQRPGGGGGDTRILNHGKLIEKGGVNFSAVEGESSPELKRMLHTTADSFYATGVSIVLHPHNPFVPIIHMNIRYFELPETGEYWFGGGIDLTPAYVFKEDAWHFHQEMRALCAAHPEVANYNTFKQQADDYFFIPHRNETRGIGGIFYDHLSEKNGNGKKETIAKFVFATGESFLNAYVPIAKRRRGMAYTEAQSVWQRIRRGRYVEFNLVHDRGTLFGLKTQGRIESILMSLPEHASWLYNHQPKENSPEAKSLAQFRKGIDWLA